jgi:hypothetical protein
MAVAVDGVCVCVCVCVCVREREREHAKGGRGAERRSRVWRGVGAECFKLELDMWALHVRDTDKIICLWVLFSIPVFFYLLRLDVRPTSLSAWSFFNCLAYFVCW